MPEWLRILLALAFIAGCIAVEDLLGGWWFLLTVPAFIVARYGHRLSERHIPGRRPHA